MQSRHRVGEDSGGRNAPVLRRLRRAPWFDLSYRLVLFAVAACLALGTLAAVDAQLRAPILIVTVLVILGDGLRVRHRVGDLGFEAVPILGSVIVLPEPALAVVASFLGILISRSIEAAITRHWRGWLLIAPAHACFAYGAAAWLYATVGNLDQSPHGRVAAAALLFGAYVTAALLLSRLTRAMSSIRAGVSTIEEVRRIGRTLLLFLPFIMLQVLLHRVLGDTAAPATFVAVLVLAYLRQKSARVERRNESLARRNRELSLIRRSQQRFLSADTEEETVKRLFALADDLIPIEAGAVVIWERDPQRPGAAVYGFGGCISTEQEIVRWVNCSGIITDIPRDALVRQESARDLRLAEAPDLIQIVVAIATVEAVHGLLILETADEAVRNAETLALLQQLVEHAAAAHQDDLLSGQLRHQTSQLTRYGEALSEILTVSHRLITQVNPVEMLEEVARAVKDVLGSHAVVISLREQGTDLLVPTAHAGLGSVWTEMSKRKESAEAMERFLASEFSVGGLYFIPAKRLWADDSLTFLQEGPDGVTLQDWSTLDMIVAPLRHDDQIIGYLAVREQRDGRPPDENQAKVLNIFADLTSAALKSAHQYEEIQKLAEKDALTSAYNHRYFQEQLRKEIGRHQRSREPFGLLMLDIDNFKRINDTLGHPAGDEILRKLVAEIVPNVRADVDTVCRYGGEEFAIILPATDRDGVRVVAERIREAVERRRFESGRTALHVTVSCGLSTFPLDGESAASLIASADAALYVAKRSGRNRVAAA
jgi:diguanylate cyclase (GGDEF)-like protein